jgi:hypothetical protein
MDQQGARRTRSAADTRRQPPWPSLEGVGSAAGPENGGPENSGPQRTSPAPTRPPGYGAGGYGPAGSGAQRVLGPGTGPQRLSGSGSGAQPVLYRGSGAQPLLSPGSGAQPVLYRGSGAQPVLSPGSGAQPVLGAPAPFPGTGSAGSAGRTPVRGFPPKRAPAEPFLGRPAEDAHPGDDSYLDDRRAPAGDDRLAPAGGEGQRAGPGRRRGGRTKRRFRIWLAAAAAVVAAAGFVSYKFGYEPTVNAPVSPTLRLPTTAPGSGSPGFDKALGQWQHIGTRAEDPEPLTVTGLYPPQFILNGSSYVRTAASVTKTCSLAVYGADLQAALQSGHCTQALRASYISGDGKLMGTVGVVNLISSSAAQKAGQVTGPQEIIAPLTGKKGATSKLGSGTGVVQAEVKGHYLILMWAEFANLKSPSGSAQRQTLEQFAENLVIGSANINLSTRMLTGRP